MANIPKTGRIYHVVDKTTGDVVKVGSTIRSLYDRFNQPDYKKKYINHFLKEIRKIESSEIDWYEKKNPLCPFMWHLVAAEHIEMLKMGTYRNGPFSNKVSPLDQKSRGLDGVIGGSLGGLIGGRIRVESGFFSLEHQSKVGKLGGQISGRRAADSGQLDRIRTHEGSVKGGTIAGRKNAESGHMSRVGHEQGLIQGKKNVENGHLARIRDLSLEPHKEGSRKYLHTRWHINRGLVSSICKFCK